MDYADDVDVDAEGELEHDTTNGSPSGSGGMTLVSDAASLSALGVPPPSSAATNATAPSALSGGGVGKRYRPAPAKTFQCRGYGECRMVFSRSEHLARHIRKHTGERPFTCHCSKQFSRLDNLRQHAQTVHADKAALNETMMRELTSLHASMTGTVPAAPSSSTTASAASPTAATSTAKSPSDGKDTKETKEKRPTTKRARASGAAVKREPVDESVGGERMGGAMAQRPGTSTGYEGAAAGYMDVDMDMDEPNERQRQRQKHEPSPPQSQTVGLGRARSFRGDGRPSSHSGNSAGRSESFRGDSFRHASDAAARDSFRGDSNAASAHSFRGDGSFRPDGSFHDPRDAGGFRDREGGEDRDRDRERPQSFLAPTAIINTSLNSHSGGRGEAFRGVGPQYVRRSPPAHTPSPPTPSFGGNGNGIPAHRLSSGAFSSSGRPFSSGNGAFPAANADSISPGSSFPGVGGGSAFPASFSSGGSGSRPSTGGGTRLPPLSAVVSSAAFRPSSGHGLPAPGTGGGILLPNSLTLRRPSTGDWEWGDAWNVRPGTAPGKLATAAIVDDSPFSFHPPDQPASFGYGVPAIGGSGNPRKRTFGSPDGPYGAYTDDGDGGGGGYEYGSESRPQSRRFSVMELCNDNDASERRPSSSFGVQLRRAGSAERERPTTTSGLISRASALVLNDNDRDQPQREHESSRQQQHAGEQHFAADFVAAGNGLVGGGRNRAGSLRGLDAAAPGGAAQTGSRPSTGAGGRGDGGVSSAAAGGAGAGGAFLSSSTTAGATAAANDGGGSLSHAAATSAAGGAGVSRSLRASSGTSPLAARARDGHGLDGAGHGDDGGVSSSGAYGTGRVSLSPPASAAAAAAAYRAGGLAGAGLPGGFGGVSPPYAHAHAASAAAPAPPSPPGAGRDAAAPRGGQLPGIAVFARVPAYAAAVPPLRGDDALLGVRRFDDGGAGGGGLRYAGTGGRAAEVREFAAGHGAGRGPGAAGYEYEHEHGVGPGHRVGGGRSGGMRV